MEIYEFDLAFESWLVLPNKHLDQRDATIQYLRFDLPTGGKKRFSTISAASSSNFFLCPFSYVFTGTQMALENSYMRVVVSLSNSDSPNLRIQLLSKPERVRLAPSKTLGTAIISLKSVLVLPVVK
eukprot:Gregarina_sp_Poly_1__5670@NODE_2992_length_1471_cov_7_477208_g1893_i0_p2_GENE_NODE_2992_length_1471_cov_7_477208_g1893_i0NODE_2992_length_1471_cov_7_477208_g1893_i0_p2_ORF_typecomplete_len126_score9_97RPGR1_C/PF18111_1/0_19_NODE_2992_length_1471_cov_7_477208_g1893_i081458